MFSGLAVQLKGKIMYSLARVGGDSPNKSTQPSGLERPHYG